MIMKSHVNSIKSPLNFIKSTFYHGKLELFRSSNSGLDAENTKRCPGSLSREDGSMAEAFEISGDTLHSWPRGVTQFIIP